jgi:hypothetical protein
MRFSVCAVALAIVMAFDAGCRSAAPFDARNEATRAPDPSGCYMRVFDTPDYRGANEYINGPAKLDRLSSLPGGQSWQKRIRSARVGPAASVTVWTGERFAGQRWMMAEGSYSMLPGTFDKSISSMEIHCATKSTPVAANSHPEPDRR